MSTYLYIYMCAHVCVLTREWLDSLDHYIVLT